MTAILIPDTTSGAAPDDYQQITQALAQRLEVPAYVGALDGGAAALASAIRQGTAAGARELVLLPLALGTSSPQLLDIAGTLQWAHAQAPELSVISAGPLASAEHLPGMLAQRAGQALAGSADAIAPAETALLLLGPGSSDAHANAELFQIARLLWEGRSYGWAECAFMRHAEPDLAAGLRRCLRLGARRVVLLPLTLLDGAGYRQIADQLQAARADLALADLLLAPPLATRASLVALLAQRYHEAIRGKQLDIPQMHHTHTDEDGRIHTHSHSHANGHSHADEPPIWASLPPRYQQGAAVSAAPMDAAPLRYDSDGKVDWDAMWQGFCELALAGGPPHRGQLLEPAAPESIRANPQGYAQVLDELERGLRLVTGRPIVRGAAPGWIGLQCESEDMALWMLRAILVENVCVRREGATLFFPAGPDYRLAHEIKNVISVAAKTRHYWAEHHRAAQR